MFGGGAGMSGMSSMLGPMIGGMAGGMAGGMFQPGSKAKDQATAGLEERLSQWDVFLEQVNRQSIDFQRQLYAQTSELPMKIVSDMTPQ
jgi:gas vesicle protein